MVDYKLPVVGLCVTVSHDVTMRFFDHDALVDRLFLEESFPSFAVLFNNTHKFPAKKNLSG